MAVAVKNTPEASSPSPLARLPIASLLGVVYVVVSLATVFSVIPGLWQTEVSPLLAPAGAFVDVALRVLIMASAAVGLVFLGLRLLGPQPPSGLKAGIFFGLLGILVLGLLTRWASVWIEYGTYDNHLFGDMGRVAGAALTAGFGLVLLIVAVGFALKPGVERFLTAFEEQGWLSTTSYKKSQGLRVRRGTILGILILTGCGIFTLMHSKRLEAGPSAWAINIPFTGKVTVEKLNDAVLVLKDRGLPVEEGLTLDRYKFRDLNEQLLARYVRITDGGDDFEEGEVISKDKFIDVVAKQEEHISGLVSAARELEAQGRPLEARNRREEADRLRLKLPKSEEPTPAVGKTTFASLTLLPSVQFTLPLLLLVGSIWLAWRIVHVPPFADFLIATEAEMNKVSWTTRRRLVQDTMVVLVTVILLAVFLLLADLVWSNGLRWIGVLRFGDGSGDGGSPAQKQRQEW